MVALLPISLLQLPYVSRLSDITLAIMIPAHAWLGTRVVIEDYLSQYSFIRSLNGLIALLSCFGLLALALTPFGLGGSIKRLWRKPKVEEIEEETEEE